MSTLVALLPIVLPIVLPTVLAVAACDDPCCRSDVDCEDGVGCFEGMCVSRCSLDTDCLDGSLCVKERCSPDDGVGEERCAGAPVPVGAQAEVP